MKTPKRHWTDNIKEAFFLNFKIPGLGKLPLNLIAVSGMAAWSFFEPVMWIPTIALETIYLVGISGTAPVLNSLREKENARKKELWEAKKIQMINKLSPAGRTRFRQLENIGKSIMQIYETSLRDSSYIDPQKVSIANQLLWLSLKLLTSKEAMISNVKGNTKEMLDVKIKNMEQNLEREKSENLRKTLEATISTMKKRAETIDQFNEKIKGIDLELLRIEEQLAFVHSIMTIDAQPSGNNLSEQIDLAQDSIAQADEWMKTNTELFGSLEEEFTEKPPEGIFVRETTT